MLAVGNYMDGLHVIADLARAVWRDGRLDEALAVLAQGRATGRRHAASAGHLEHLLLDDQSAQLKLARR